MTWLCGRLLIYSLLLRILIELLDMPDCIRSHLCRFLRSLLWCHVMCGEGRLALLDSSLETSIALLNLARIGRGEHGIVIEFAQPEAFSDGVLIDGCFDFG